MPTSIADPGPPPTEKSGGSKRGLIIGGIAAAVVAIGVVAALALGGGGDEPITAGSTTVADSSTVATSIATTEAPETTTSVATTTTMPPTTTTVPVCDLDAPDLCIEITSVEIQPDGENLLIVWEAVNFESSINANHGHFFWSSFDVEKVGSQAGADADPWDAIASQPFETSSSSASSIAQRPTNGDQICVTPANGSHAVIDPTIFHCVDVPFDGS